MNGGQIARQCLDAGLLDEFHVDLVPALTARYFDPRPARGKI